MLFLAKKLLNAQAREHVCAGAMARELLDGNGGARAAGVWRLLMDLMDLMDKMGAPLYTPWVCLPQSGLARVIDVPQGGAGCMAAGVCVSRRRGAGDRCADG